MRGNSIRLLLLVLSAAAIFFSRAGIRGAAQTPERGELKTLYYGNAACGGATCHGSAKPVAEPGQEKPDGMSTAFSRHHELHFWDANDKHKIATRVLTEGRGKDMAQRLGIVGDLADPKANRAWRPCLACHGVVIDDERDVAADSFGPAERIGPHEEWVNEHVKPLGNKWRSLTREQKQQQFGLTDLWNATRRAELCSSCHVGDAAQGRFVTHAMYAAGHPPLPGFELVTFTVAMPRHWETMKEKYARLPQLKATYDKVYHLGTGFSEQLDLLSTGAAVALRNSVQLLVDQARPAKERDWPEFALYDCYACHHDLKAESWRLQRANAGKPGRPQLREWPAALAPLFVRPDAPAELPQKLGDLHAVFNRTPFGDPLEVRPRAGALAAWCDAALDRLRTTRYERGDAAKLLHALIRESGKDLLDFDSARQVGWAVQVLLDEALPGAGKATDLKEPLERLGRQLALSLREESPLNTITRRAEYDAFEFQRNLRALTKALPKQ
jgi:hypothetical protein